MFVPLAHVPLVFLTIFKRCHCRNVDYCKLTWSDKAGHHFVTVGPWDTAFSCELPMLKLGCKPPQAPDAGAAAAVAADADAPSVRQKAASSLLKAAKDGSLEKSLQNFEEKEAEAQNGALLSC